MKDASSRLEELRAEMRYRRARLALYRAKLYRNPSSSQTRLRELERASEGAQERLRSEEDREAAQTPDPPDARA